MAENRIRRLESEVRALQRKVFPGGDGRYFEPEISAQPSVDSTANTSSTTRLPTSSRGSMRWKRSCRRRRRRSRRTPMRCVC